FAFFYRASLGGPDERREQKFATLVGDHFGMSPTNILLTLRICMFLFHRREKNGKIRITLTMPTIRRRR
ncbi:hypothetical protein P9711_17170, partial [Anoxybacillus geothermalis]|nr:hypothetical protein [Anoxybacillus geothermalis]